MAKEHNQAESFDKSRERSVAYPGIDLKSAIELIEALRTSLGKGPYSREEAAKGLGYNGLSGASARVVAALTHYGLLERQGNTYVQTHLAQEILHPIDESGKAIAIKKSVRMPKLFAKLIERYNGQALPALLENILMRDGVSGGSAKEVAKTFRESLQFAGLLKNGVVAAEAEGSKLSLEENKNKESAQVNNSSESVIPATTGAHIFQYAGGVSMVIPGGNQAAEEAMLDGELKEVKGGLKEFAEKYFGNKQEKKEEKAEVD